ncbi:hypothetical protein HDU99_004807, partial [Rhizoclosmatium hyalinum]
MLSQAILEENDLASRRRDGEALLELLKKGPCWPDHDVTSNLLLSSKKASLDPTPNPNVAIKNYLYLIQNLINELSYEVETGDEWPIDG